MPLKIKTHGIILGTENHEACAAFYRDIIGLEVWFEKPGLTCFHFGSSYLMVESEDVASDFRKPGAGTSTMLRFNVENIDQAADELRAKGVNVKVTTHDWGTTATFTDPNGNPCELKNADDRWFDLNGSR